MKYIKTFEIVHSYPKEGDYVILNAEHYIILNPNFYKFIKNKIFKIEKHNGEYFTFNINNKIKYLTINSIKYWADNEEELQIYIESEKYNI